jgi:hypothetical protein
MPLYGFALDEAGIEYLLSETIVFRSGALIQSQIGERTLHTGKPRKCTARIRESKEVEFKGARSSVA